MGTKNMNRPIYVVIVKTGGLYHIGGVVVDADKRKWGESEREYLDEAIRG